MAHKEQVAENRERQVNLRKDLLEMQEWMAQVDEEFLMRDFEYKSPEELEASLEEMKVTDPLGKSHHLHSELDFALSFSEG